MPRCPAWLRFLRPLRAASPERLSDLDVLTPLSASHFPERQTARRKNLLQAWQDHGHEPPTIESVSTRQPLAPTASSVPMRQRRITVCPLRLGPRFTTVLIYPLELPLHASRSASGLLAVLSIVPVYSPLTKLPPTAASVTSVNAPPLILGEDTSNTPPSQNVPSLNSVSKLFRNESTGAAELITTPLRSSTLSLITAVSVTNALLPTSGFPAEVAHAGGGPVTIVCVHPLGNAGGVIVSKVSVHATAGVGVGDEGGGVGVIGGTGVLPGVADATGVGVGVGRPGVGVGIGAPPLPSPRS